MAYEPNDQNMPPAGQFDAHSDLRQLIGFAGVLILISGAAISGWLFWKVATALANP